MSESSKILASVSGRTSSSILIKSVGRFSVIQYRIIENIPTDLISIEELVLPKEEVNIFEDQNTLNLRERESIFYSPFRIDAWYL